MGAFAKAATTPTELTGNAIPKEISGVGGPKDLQGNLITPEKYAEYGITNTQPQTPTFQTTAGVSPTTAGQPTTNYWKSPSGTIVGVSAGSEAENNFKNLGWTQSTAAEEVAGRNVQMISPTGEIQTTGELDMTGWSQAQIDAYNASKDYVDNLAKQGQVINPDIEINQSIIDKFTEQAKTELGPYYNQIFSQAKSDMERASKQLADSYSSQERNLGEQYGKALEGTQESFARRGLSDSTMRTGAERELATQTERSLTDLQKGTEQAAENIGITGEREVGTANMPSLGSYNTGARPILGQAGVYGITPSSQSRSLYTPQGGTTGTREQERLTAEEQRKRDLIGSEREYRASAYL
jgi:hypothetical protein